MRKKGVRVDPRFMKAIMDVESGGDGTYPASRCRPSDGFDNVPACGPMQIKQTYHQQRCPECDFSTVPGQIELATHIIGDTMKARGRDEYDALLTTYFPGGDINGTTQKAYVDRVRALVAQMQGTTPAPPPNPKPVTEADVLKLIAGPTAYVGFGFNQPNMSCGNSGAEPCHFYTYGVNHGTSADYMHTGNDIIIPRGTTVHTPLAGRVVCVGEQGEVVWGEGCGSFTDTSGGVGNVTVLTDAGVKIVFGHCAKSLVSYNQRVTAGQPVALSGTNRSDHLHLDVTIKRNGTYWLVDPLPAIVAALGGASLPEGTADPVDIPQPDSEPPYLIVKAIRKTPVLQRGNPDSPKILPDLQPGVTFFAQHQVLGVDGRWYWVGRLKGRVAADDTEVAQTVLA